MNRRERRTVLRARPQRPKTPRKIEKNAALLNFFARDPIMLQAIGNASKNPSLRARRPEKDVALPKHALRERVWVRFP